jgi:PAS domain S-box-containing protein
MRSTMRYPRTVKQKPGLLEHLQQLSHSTSDEDLLRLLTGSIERLTNSPAVVAVLPMPTGEYRVSVAPDRIEQSGRDGAILRFVAGLTVPPVGGQVLAPSALPAALASLTPRGCYCFPLAPPKALSGVLLAGIPPGPDPEEVARATVAQLAVLASSQLDVLRLRAGDALATTAVEHSLNSVVITDRQGHIIYVNPAFERLTGYGSREALGRTPKLLKSGVHPPNFYRKLWDNLLNGRPWRGEVVNRKKNGDLYDAALSIAPVIGPDGKVTHMVASHREITREKAVMRSLQEKIRELATVNVALEEKSKVASELEQLRGDLIGIVSHDLRGPTCNIVSYADLILETKDELPKSQLQPLRRIRENALFMLELISDLLDTHRVESGKVKCNLEVHNADDLIRMSIDRCAFLASDKRIRLEGQIPKTPLPVLVDQSKTVQILNNLISNAIKFSESDTTITVGARPDGDFVEFWVEDQGQGIPEPEVGKLFLKFSRTSTRATRGEKGTGLGLFIVRELAQLQGGTVRVTTAPKKGSCFYVRLPAARATVPSTPEAP